VAIEEGATRIDGSLAGMGAGAGNAALEQLIAVMNKLTIPHNMDLYKTMDAAENVMKPIMVRPGKISIYIQKSIRWIWILNNLKCCIWQIFTMAFSRLPMGAIAGQILV